jgi:hypothetical protein
MGIDVLVCRVWELWYGARTRVLVGVRKIENCARHDINKLVDRVVLNGPDRSG